MQRIFNKILIIYCCCAFGSIILIIKYSDYFSASPEDPDNPIILHIKYARPVVPITTVKSSYSDENVGNRIDTEFSSNLKGLWNENKTEEIRIRYDEKVQDEFRLGFRVNPPVLTLPKSWQETLKEHVTFLAEMQEDKVDNSTNQIKPKKILLYDSFDWWNFGFLKCPSIPKEYKCEFKDREIVDKDMEGEPQDFSDMDAVVLVRDFQHRELIPSQQGNKTLSRIFFSLESPYAVSFSLTMSPRDYLASYWRGSDIHAPYFKWNYHDPKITRKKQSVDYAMGKTKMAAAVISNCAASNRRMDLVKELKKYIDVDVYGLCGDIDCQARPDRTSCFEDIKANYKFYLSFENSNCRDYITEKLHQNAYENDLLPIVYGAHPSDYASLVPAHSFIHVEDFESMRALGEYLRLLHENDTLYNEYFEWKNTGEFVPGHFFCEVCALLHMESNLEMTPTRPVNHDRSIELESLQDLPYLNTKDAYDFQKFQWDPGNQLMCLPVGQYYWNK